ncbi:hypothetical protein [Pseudomonas syringae]|uniref:hypothetical protein n=1 Tax=Pseudomonas syringae TaxID=317 RepID=UPI0024647322|nr:hypothetical protein [Pseudomonas syringae]MDH4602323.1 hypothetical protein [Pseudomonas syringae pv. papulans]
METKRKLPESAYAALEGLKAQAGAATLMLPGNDVKEGKKALKTAHAQMAANINWVDKIIKAISAAHSENTELTVVTADAEWLEQTFGEAAS